MRVTKYDVFIGENEPLTLVKESSSNYPEAESLQSPDSIWRLMKDVFHAHLMPEEHVWLLALNTKCRLIGAFEISHGTGNSSCLSMKNIFTRLLLCGSNAFVIVHNHPSQDTFPSGMDNEVTAKVKAAANLMDIQFCDHIIVGKDNYFSYAENQKL